MAKKFSVVAFLLALVAGGFIAWKRGLIPGLSPMPAHDGDDSDGADFEVHDDFATDSSYSAPSAFVGLPEDDEAPAEPAAESTEDDAAPVSDVAAYAEAEDEYYDSADVASETEQSAPSGSHPALADGSAPEGFSIKGNTDSMLYHVPGSRFYDRTVAELWFATAEDAEAAGYQLPKSQRKAD